MKKIIFAAAVALVFLAEPRNTSAQEISFGAFYSSLAPYGEWVSTGGYGMCWRPAGVPADWTPYTFGHWVWTDYGWTWVSGYPWGWAPFHYGRWVLDSYYGWIWVPGYVWAPAWVQWRWGDGYCGWAPLPPGFHFRVDVVIGPNDRDFGVGLRGWNFVRANEMGLTRYRMIDRDEVPHFFGRTRNVTRLRFTSKGVYDIGLQREQVEKVTRRRITTVNILRTDQISRQRVAGNEIRVYSPAPFQPRVRDEQQVIRRERATQTPERYRVSRPEPSMPVREMSKSGVRQQQHPAPAREMSRPSVKQQHEAHPVVRQRGENVGPKREAPKRVREQPKKNDKKDNEKGPRHRH